MTPKERAAMQQALDALKDCVEKFYAMKSTGVIGALPMQAVKAAQAITALREALAEQAEQEPVGVVEGSGEWGIAGVLVAGVPIGTKLYATPVRTKDLTEYELDELRFQNLNYLDYARAVIAADREKNK